MTIVPWKLEDGRVIHLITPKELEELPDGTELICINGETVIKGTDSIDLETCNGVIAYGQLVSENDNP